MTGLPLAEQSFGQAPFGVEFMTPVNKNRNALGNAACVMSIDSGNIDDETVFPPLGVPIVPDLSPFPEFQEPQPPEAPSPQKNPETPQTSSFLL